MPLSKQTGFPEWIDTTSKCLMMSLLLLTLRGIIELRLYYPEDAMIEAEVDSLQRLSVEKAEFVDAFLTNSKGNLEVRRNGLCTKI